MFLETLINKAIIKYKHDDSCVFHKLKLPIVFSSIKSEQGKLKVENAWVEEKSASDYYGIYCGRFVAFEAKSTKTKSIPLSNIKDHQIKYLENIKRHGGISFFILGFSTMDQYYGLEIDKIKNLDSKSLSINYVKKEGFELNLLYPGYIDFKEFIDYLLKN